MHSILDDTKQRRSGALDAEEDGIGGRGAVDGVEFVAPAGEDGEDGRRGGA